MSQKDLEAVRTQLLSLPPDSVVEPWGPAAVILQEANDLATYVRQGHVRERLLAVGLAGGTLERLPTAVGAARAAQSLWTVTRDRSKSAAQKEREARGIELRRELMAAARWSLRADPVAVSTLNLIAEGDGLPDLIQDLSDLAQLMEQNAAAFGADTTLDLSARVEQARSLSSELSAGTSAEQLDGTQLQAKELRNRAFVALDQLVSDVREAGRYAMRGGESAKRFTSDFLRRRRATAARKREQAAGTSDSSAS